MPKNTSTIETQEQRLTRLEAEVVELKEMARQLLEMYPAGVDAEEVK